MYQVLSTKSKSSNKKKEIKILRNSHWIVLVKMQYLYCIQ